MRSALVALLFALLCACDLAPGPTPSSELERGAYDGDLPAIRSALAAGAPIEGTGRNALGTPLMIAIAQHHPAVVSELLARGASVRATNYDGTTPLHAAARAGDRALVEDLLARGADLHASGDHGTALYDAAFSGDLPTLELLLGRGLDPRDQRNRYSLAPIHGAAEGGSGAAVRRLLEAGADPRVTDNSGGTALHWARSVDAATALLDAGVEPDIRGPRRNAPLHGYLPDDVATLLLERGADANPRDGDGATPLHRHGCDSLWPILVAHGADPSLTDSHGVAPRPPGPHCDPGHR